MGVESAANVIFRREIATIDDSDTGRCLVPVAPLWFARHHRGVPGLGFQLVTLYISCTV